MFIHNAGTLRREFETWEEGGDADLDNGQEAHAEVGYFDYDIDYESMPES